MHRRFWGWRRRRQRGVLIEWLSRRLTPLSGHPVYVWTCVRIRETCACACVCVCARVDAYVATERRALYIQSASRKMIPALALACSKDVRGERKMQERETRPRYLEGNLKRKIWENNLVRSRSRASSQNTLGPFFAFKCSQRFQIFTLRNITENLSNVC